MLRSAIVSRVLLAGAIAHPIVCCVDHSSAQAAIVVTGNTTPDYNNTDPWAVSSLTVGNTAPGSMTINGGSVINNTRTGIVANSSSSSVSTVSVTGAGSKWTNTGSLLVGGSGNGTLDISNGGSVTSTSGFLGRSSGGNGIVTVGGGSGMSTWTNSNLQVGQNGSGELHITGGGTVQTASVALVRNGIVTVGGGTGVSTWTNSILHVGFSGTGVLDITGGGNVRSDSEAFIGFGGNGTVTVGGGTGSATWTVAGALNFGQSGMGTLNINTGGLVSAKWVLGGDAPSSVNFDGGTLRIDTDGSLRTINLLSGGGTFDIPNKLPNVASTFITTGSIGDSGSLTKTGAGVMMLRGASTYAGGTTVSGGTLLIRNSAGSGTGSGPVVVAAGATLGGNGSITGDVTVNGSLLSPADEEGVFDQGALTFNQGSSFIYDFYGSTRFADLVNVSGDLTINPRSALAIRNLGNSILPMGAKLTLINYSGTWNGGAFDGHPQRSSFVLGANKFQILYDDPTGGSNFGGGSFGSGSGHVTITVVPEPNSFVVFGVCGLVAIATGRLTQRAVEFSTDALNQQAGK